MKYTRGPWKWAHAKYQMKRGKKMVKIYPLLLQGDASRPYLDAYENHVLSVSWPHRKGEIKFGGLKDGDTRLMEMAPEMYELIKTMAASNLEAKALLKRIETVEK